MIYRENLKECRNNMEYINIKYSETDNQVRTDTNFHRAKKSSQGIFDILLLIFVNYLKIIYKILFNK